MRDADRPSPASKVTTIEGAPRARPRNAVQAAWIEDGRAAMRLLPVGPDHDRDGAAGSRTQPTDADIDDAMSGNICRCGDLSAFAPPFTAAAIEA